MACKNFFSFNFPVREFFFVLLRQPPTPDKFSNGPSLKVYYPMLMSQNSRFSSLAREVRSLDCPGLTLYDLPRSLHRLPRYEIVEFELAGNGL